jgi:hypothetical protein
MMHRWLVAAVIAWAATFALLVATNVHGAELKLAPAQCAQLAEIAEYAAELRDLGASGEKYTATLRARNTEIGQDLWDVVEREIKQAFASSLPPEGVALEVLTRCKNLQGKMGTGA